MFVRALLICLFSSCASAAELRFVTFDVAPWAYLDEKGRYLGVFPDLMREIERRTGHSIVISLTPLVQKRVHRELEAGRQDCAMTVAGEKRALIEIVGPPVFKLPMGVIARKEIKINGYDDLKGLKISALKLLSENKKIMDDFSLSTVPSPDYISGLRKISHGRIDAIAGAIPTIRYLAALNDISDLLGEPFVMNYDPVVWQCSVNSKNLQHMEKINQAIADIKRDGMLEKISKIHSWD